MNYINNLNNKMNFNKGLYGNMFFPQNIKFITCISPIPPRKHPYNIIILNAITIKLIMDNNDSNPQNNYSMHCFNNNTMTKVDNVGIINHLRFLLFF